MRPHAPALFLLALLPASVSAAPPAAPVPVKDTRANVEMCVDAIRTSQKRGQNLMVRLIPRKEAAGEAKPVTVTFPAHSLSTLEFTLMNIIQALRPTGGDPYEWQKPTRPARFSVPPTRELGHWYFVDFSCP